MAGKDAEQLEFPYIAQERKKWYYVSEKEVVSYEVRHTHTQHPASPL